MANHRRGWLLTILFFCTVLMMTVLPTTAFAQPSPGTPHAPRSYPPRLLNRALSGSGSVARSNPRNLDCAPAPCVFPNVQASGGNPPGTDPVNENPIATNPRNRNELLTGGNDYNCPGIVGAGFYTTGNKGLTWRSHCMVALPNEAVFGDPGVGYNTRGIAYAVAMNAIPRTQKLNAIAIESSSNNGRTWNPPRLAVTPVLPGGTLDKPWLQIDVNPNSPFANALYISTTQLGANETTDTIAVSHSTNGGATWSTTIVDAVQSDPLVDQFSDLAIGRDGTVYVTWMRCSATGPTGKCGGSTATFYLARSTNGGVTWSTPRRIATVRLAPDTCTPDVNCFYGTLPNTNERVANIPVIGVQSADAVRQHGNSGTLQVNRPLHNDPTDRLFVVFYNWTGTFMQVEVAASMDGGTTWLPPVPVAPRSIRHDQFFPWLSVNEDGIVGVTWLDRRNDPANLSYETFAAVSQPGSISFGTNIQIADTPSNPNNDGFDGTFMGDYTGNSWSNEMLYASWMDSRNGVNMQDEVGGLRRRQQ